MNKSFSESNIAEDSPNKSDSTSSFVSLRNKRKREKEDFSFEFSVFKEEMKSLIHSMVSTNSEEIKKITPTLADIQQSNRNIENSIAFLTSQNEEYKKKIELLEMQAQEDRKYITILEDKIEDIQKGMRKTSFEVKNVPRNDKETKEDLLDMVTCLSKNIDCEISRSDIRDIYRVRPRKEGQRNTPIIIETMSTITKNNFLKM
ncbi:jg2369, partial [Pararge aegeria aegeria]